MESNASISGAPVLALLECSNIKESTHAHATDRSTATPCFPLLSIALLLPGSINSFRILERSKKGIEPAEVSARLDDL
eukprot:11622931-Karenia_brevis.AAC.1